MDKNKTYYLAGPMSGYPQFNYPAFDAAAKHLRERGYKIISPAEVDSEACRQFSLASKDGNPANAPETWGQVLGRDVQIIADQVQGIVFLTGWQQSRGARLEALVGLLCGHEFYIYGPHNIYPLDPEYVKKGIV